MVSASCPGPLRPVGAAIALLTCIPARLPVDAPRGDGAFALVGAALGLAAALPVLVIGARAPMLAAAAAVAILAAVSGGLHLDGLSDTIDALAAPDRAGAERARRDPAAGALGAAGTSLVLIADVGALAALAPGVALPALLVGAAASRSVPVVVAPWVRHAEDGMGAWWGRSVRRRSGAICVATTAGIGAAAGPTHVAAAVVSLAVGIAFVGLLLRRLGAASGDMYGASVEVTFLAALAFEAVLA